MLLSQEQYIPLNRGEVFLKGFVLFVCLFFFLRFDGWLSEKNQAAEWEQIKIKYLTSYRLDWEEVQISTVVDKLSPVSVIPEGMSTMSNKYSMITFTINKTVTENWSTKVQKQRNSAATFIHLITEFTPS